MPKKKKSEKKTKKTRKIKISNQLTVTIVLFLVFASVVAGFLMFRKTSTMDIGDKVTISSKVYTEEGVLISDSQTNYTFYVGDSTFADEIENAVKTMKIGKTKKIFMDANTAKIYPMKIVSIPQKVVFNATYEIDKSKMPNAEIGDVFVAEGTNWNSTVISISADKVIAKYAPKDMENIKYNYLDAVLPAKAVISKDGQRFSAVFNLAAGDKVKIYQNEYVVRSASNIAITMHLNRILSGTKLVQEITLLNVERKSR